jgi:hypothetical protein
MLRGFVLPTRGCERSWRRRTGIGKAGFDVAMPAALGGEEVLAADETPVNVPDRTPPSPTAAAEQDGKAAGGAPHVLITRTPDGRLTFTCANATTPLSGPDHPQPAARLA